MRTAAISVLALLMVSSTLPLFPRTVLAEAKYAGVRSSRYGINPFPTPAGWGNALNAMASTFPGSQPTAIWIVGTVDSSIDGTDLEFPSDGQVHERISFSDIDKHEAYLNYFDQNGMKVFLQVEPGLADVNTLIDLVLTRYKHHPSVIGFGVDVEWYQNVTDGHPGVPVTDAIAMGWEGNVKSHNSSYRLFIKHYDKTYLCPTYRGDIVFVDDTQQFSGISGFVSDMVDFADSFYPNTVMYQIGYPDDRSWWSKYVNPPKSLGDELVAGTRQECGIIWVDFTLREVLPTDPTGPGPDTLPPTVISTNPPDGATGIPIGTPVTATFSEEMDASSIVQTAFILASAGGNVSGTVNYSGSLATFLSASTLAYNTTYTATVTTAVKDVAGNRMSSNRTWTFTTEQAPTGGSGGGGGGCTISPVGTSDNSSPAGVVLALLSPVIVLFVRRTMPKM